MTDDHKQRIKQLSTYWLRVGLSLLVFAYVMGTVTPRVKQWLGAEEKVAMNNRVGKAEGDIKVLQSDIKGLRELMNEKFKHTNEKLDRLINMVEKG